jgi:hypothetical protein
MDAHDLFGALRDYHRKRRAELLEGLVGCEDIQKQRGRILELDVSYDALLRVMKTTGDDDVD